MSTNQSSKLFIEHQFPISHNNVAAILKAYDLNEFSYLLADSGVENATLILDTEAAKYALRIYRQFKKSTAEVRLELMFAQYLSIHGIPSPKTVETKTGDIVAEVTVSGRVWQAVLMDFEEGDHPVKYTHALLTKMAILQAHMHTLGIEFGEEMHATKAIKSLEPGSLVVDIDLEDLVNDRLSAFVLRANKHSVALPGNLPHGFSHFDFDRGNILLVGEDISAVLDFDDTHYGPVVICLANTIWDILAISTGDEAVHLYIETYESSRQMSEDELSLIPDIVLYRHYLISCMKISFGKLAEDDLEKYLSLENRILLLHSVLREKP